MGNKIDLTGKKFGKLFVLSECEKRGADGSIFWLCQCDCGTILQVNGKSLRNSGQKSCGCAQLEWAKNQHNRQTHGGRKDRLYHIWRGMIDRCYYPSHNRYKDYGGRGIAVCEEWRDSYSAFRDWAITAGYDESAPRGQCTIDRIDVDGNYCPKNCRWADMAEQNKNKRKKGAK